MAERVGVRELRQNLSVYLRRVLKGESLEVTEHGTPVAMLIPLPAAASALERLHAAGRVALPAGSQDDVPAPRGPVTTGLSDALREERAERL